jgi:hypothetical protein
LRLLNTFRGWHSAANVDFRPSGNAKVIAMRPFGAVFFRRPVAVDRAQNRPSPKVVFDRLVGAMRADA